MIQNYNGWRVFKQFLENPKKKHNIREISRNIKLATTSVKNYVEELIKLNLVIEKKDIFKYYEANFDNEQFRFYKKINNQLNIQDSGLTDFLDKECTPEVIILFGSYAKGEDIETSDIDLYVQSPKKELNLMRFEKKLNKKIQILFYEDISKIPKELRNNILNGLKLKGFMRFF